MLLISLELPPYQRANKDWYRTIVQKSLDFVVFRMN